ncbi:MAG: efflux transporter outer membrane subunit [Pirellulales bacterium]
MAQGRVPPVVVLLATILAGVSGCKVGPDYRACHDLVRAEWSQQLDESLRTDGALDQAWWKSLGDPALNALVERAVVQNLSLQEAAARIQEARARVGVARGGLFPEVYQTDSFTRIDISDNGSPFGVTGLAFPPFDFWSTGFDSSWEIDVFGRVRRTLEAARSDVNASIENRNAVRVTLLGDVAMNYVTLRVTEQRILNAQENARIQGETVRITTQRFQAGAVSELDVSQAQTLLFRTRSAIPQLERERDRAIYRLCVLQGEQPQSLDTVIGLHGTIPRPPAQIDVGIPMNLLRQRPDVRQAEWDVLAQSARIGVATADLYPRFSLIGIFTLDANQFNQIFDGDSLAMRTGPQVRWNILNFGRVRGNIDAQDAKFRQAATRYRQVVLNAAEEVENALVAYRRNRESERELAQAVGTARSAAQLAGDQYKAGAVSFQTLLDAERSLVLTLDEFIATQGNVTLSVVQLYKALGGGWDSSGADAVAPLPQVREEIGAPPANAPPAEVLPMPQNPLGPAK